MMQHLERIRLTLWERVPQSPLWERIPQTLRDVWHVLKQQNVTFCFFKTLCHTLFIRRLTHLLFPLTHLLFEPLLLLLLLAHSQELLLLVHVLQLLHLCVCVCVCVCVCACVRVYVYHDHVSGAACSTQHLEVLK
jgi:hypothetical protein